MKAIQTFWCGGLKPQHHNFGWLHPEYNLMAWALSCLSLKELFDSVTLYTDEVGKQWLID